MLRVPSNFCLTVAPGVRITAALLRPRTDTRARRPAQASLAPPSVPLGLVPPAHPALPKYHNRPGQLANGYAVLARIGYTLYYGMITLRYASVVSSSLGVRNNYLRFAVKLCEALRRGVMSIDCIRSLPLGAAAWPEGHRAAVMPPSCDVMPR